MKKLVAGRRFAVPAVLALVGTLAWSTLASAQEARSHVPLVGSTTTAAKSAPAAARATPATTLPHTATSVASQAPRTAAPARAADTSSRAATRPSASPAGRSLTAHLPAHVPVVRLGSDGTGASHR